MTVPAVAVFAKNAGGGKPAFLANAATIARSDMDYRSCALSGTIKTKRILPGGDFMNLPDFLTRDADGYIHLTGHRIGIQHIVYFYNEGYSPEMLLGQFPTLTLALIHKSIAFYLENQSEIDTYIAECTADLDRQQAAAKKGPSLAELRRRMQAISRVHGV